MRAHEIRTLASFSHSHGMFTFDQTTKTQDEGDSVLLQQRLRETFGREREGAREERREIQRGESTKKTKGA